MYLSENRHETLTLCFLCVGKEFFCCHGDTNKILSYILKNILGRLLFLDGIPIMQVLVQGTDRYKMKIIAFLTPIFD